MIVFVHGLWLTGIESLWLRRRLSAALNQPTRSFHYPSVTATPEAVVDSLHDFIIALRADTVHLVCHSLGGIVALRLLEKYSDVPPGRIVLLGSPLAGSAAAKSLARARFGAAMLGRTAQRELLEVQPRRWDGRRDLGIIAGDLPFGLGRLISSVAKPHDGTVAVAETYLPGARQHIVLPVSHTGMQFSAAVARHTAHFLEYGRFADP